MELIYQKVYNDNKDYLTQNPLFLLLSLFTPGGRESWSHMSRQQSAIYFAHYIAMDSVLVVFIYWEVPRV